MCQNFIFIQYQNIENITLDSLLPSSLLSEQVKIQAKSLPNIRKIQFLSCRQALAKLLLDYFSIPQLPNIIIGANNRPCFEDDKLPDFNITHSGSYIAVGVSSQGKIGLDIEVQRERKNYLSIAKQFFSEQENIWLNQQKKDQLSAFWQLWTLRESALKLYSKGVWQMKDIKIAMPKTEITANFGKDFYTHYFSPKNNSIHLSVCCNHPVHNYFIQDDTGM